jgi:predicted DNA-binding transcriptional regulator YafY
MPINKNSFRRYKIINELLGSARHYTAREIMEHVNEQLEMDGFEPVTQRLIYKDIEDIQKVYPVTVERKKGRFHYASREDDIERVPLTREERTRLFLSDKGTSSLFQTDNSPKSLLLEKSTHQFIIKMIK